MRLLPAEVDSGIRFRRVDLPGQPEVPAHVRYVTDTRLGTTLTKDGVSIATVEHLMAALSGLGVDNVIIELDAPEVPIMDGSSEPFVFLLECAGLQEQSALRRYLRVMKPVSVELGHSRATLLPHDGLMMDVTIAFDDTVVARQHAVVDFGAMHFKDALGRARTFGFVHEVEYLQSQGLALGGSLKNAIVVGKETILNQDGLRYQDEFVRHKMLDCVGDLALAGRPILGKLVAERPGHTVNAHLVKCLLEQDGAFTEATRSLEGMAAMAESEINAFA